MFVRIQPDIPKIEKLYWYRVSDETKNADLISTGCIVRIPLHGRRVRGWVLETSSENQTDAELKDVIEFVSVGPPAHLVSLCLELGRYYLISPVSFLRSASPQKIVRNHIYKEVQVAHSGTSEITTVLVDPRADRRSFIDDKIASSGTTLIVAPDSHTRLASWARDHGHHAIQYSHEAKNSDSFREATQENSVIVGGRVALFAPTSDCASIIILDDAYEQMTEERSPKWNVTTCARIYASMFSVPVTIITSVPSSVTHDTTVIDARTSPSWPRIKLENRNNTDPALGVFSRDVVNALRKALDAGFDASVIINNTVNAKMLVCKKCDTLATCENCGHGLHQDDTHALPFVCATCRTEHPMICLSCGSSSFKRFRRGLQSTVQDCERLFTPYKVVEVTKDFQLGETKSAEPTLYVGTEAIFHRPSLTSRMGCCVFLDLDSILFRAGMTAFLQTFVIVNRALRCLKKSELTQPLIISTRAPDHVVLVDIAAGEFVTQRDRDLELREQLKLAPHYATAEISAKSASMDVFIVSVPAELVAGKTYGQDKTTILMRTQSHDQLAQTLYDPLRKLASRHRCTISVDTYD